MAAAESVSNDRLELLERKLNAVIQRDQARVEQIEALESRLDEKDERIAELETTVERLDARTDLMRVIEQSDEMTAKQRSITLLQHLQRAAEKQASDSSVNSAAKSSVTRKQAEIALQHPDVDRTTIYTDMKRAARLVDDDDVCWYSSDGDGESRLWLDLDAGHIPAEFNTGE